MEKQWKAVITLDVNATGADLGEWERRIGRCAAVMPETVFIDRHGPVLHLNMVVASESADYGVTQALRSALSAYRRSFRSMRFKGPSMGLVTAVYVEKTRVEPALKKGSE